MNFEWLAGVMDELDRRAGAGVFDEAMFARQLPSRIAIFEDRLRFEQVLRSALSASPQAVHVAPPATAVAADG